ncbi:hypothetical protein [Pseudoalteromonas tunicata]|uniref:Uncharacterized protein n=1 Tax=Pseudoalteromonas tunicata D2 TaxID=87626 RepID=A4C508_9GAMM|nr:hypothetical protein [Pseudoalteromonas tunicata]ATC96887.1 hypothetical protein PTUN_b0511 [Pseudoalteromonas tunicata]AXT33021.1 hypothetical protein D1819_19520 [Pseudoalteromonas tunicata]EAR30640.1 hypothetical protein PTD2_03686 [Pseudoalteromonas tunicata D2]
MKNNNTAAQWIKPLIWLSVLFIGFFAEINQSYGYGWLDVHRFRHGWVLARGLVLENDSPIYVEYDDKGKVVGGLHKLATDLPGGTVISADYVNATYDILEDNQQQYGGSLQIMSVDNYNSATLLNGLNKSVKKVEVSNYYKTVVIRDTKTLISDFQPHVLMLARFDLNSIGRQTTAKSLLIDKYGALVYASDNTISFKSAFFEGDEGEQALPPTFKDLRDVETYAPFKNAFVEVLAPYGGLTSTGEDGRWVSQYGLIPCPMFFFEYNTNVWMKYYYAAYNPRNWSPYEYQWKPGYDACIGYDAMQPTDLVGLMVKIAIIGILSNISVKDLPYTFYVDSTVATGGAKLTSLGKSVSIGAQTQYVYQAPDLEPIAQPLYDFDGDLIPERTLFGNLDSTGQFSCTLDKSAASYYGVYFSSKYSGLPLTDCNDAKADLIQPDVMRVIDINPDLSHQGLLGEISSDDLQDTDIFIFRESTGMLITQRKGVDLRDGVSHYGTEDDTFMYGILMRGPAAAAFGSFDERFESGFASYQSRSHMNPDLHRRDANHLRPNELIRIVLINRKTGYIGTSLKSYSDIGKWNTVKDLMSRINMGPPNLSITAERFYTADEMSSKPGDNKNIISYEGSASSKDEMIVLTTEWLDHDGTPLPKGLEDYGYTGRLAKVGGANTLVTAGGMMANFAIIPGRNIVQIKLPGDGNTNEHFYVNVSGAPISENPSFADIGAASSGPLAHRPKNYVPFKVPVFDEIQTTLSTLLYKKAKKDGLANNLDAPKPIYHYLYRPEYQFSTYQLNLKKLSRHTNSGDVIHLQGKKRPLIGSSDSMVKLMYDLIASQHEALEFLGQGQELVFALGADEIKATIGEDGQIIFDRLDHIASLDVEDFVTLSLYNNTDPTNVLWDYAFRTVSLTPQRNTKLDNNANTITITADVAANSYHAVSAKITPASEKPEKLNWGIEGQGSLLTKETMGNNGLHVAKADLSTKAGDKTTLYAYSGEENNRFYSLSVETIAGSPFSVEKKTSSGETAIAGLGEAQWQFIVKDKFGNLVKDGTNIRVSSFSLNVESVSPTINGVTTVKLKGIRESGDNEFDVIVAEGISYPFKQYVHDINIEVNVPTEVEIKTELNFSVKAKSTYGNLEGLNIDLAVHRGKLDKYAASLTSTGIHNPLFYSGNFPGIAQFSAKIAGTDKIATQSFKVIPKEDYLESSILTLGGETTIDLTDGKTRTFGSSTRLHVNTIPNDNVSLEIGSIFEPPLYPLIDYSSDFGILQHNILTDYSNGIDAITKNISLVQSNKKNTINAFQFNKTQYKQTYIDIPEHDKLTGLTSAGINFSINLNDTSSLSEEVEIVDWDNFGLRLKLNTDQTLALYIDTVDGTESLIHSQVLQQGQWHNVAMHIIGDKVKLGVSGSIVELKLASSIQAKNTKSYALRFTSSSNQLTSFQLTEIKLFDWLSEATLTFDDGTFNADLIADNTGKAAIKVTAHQPVTAYKRLYQSSAQRTLLANLIVSKAYADQTFSQCFDLPVVDPNDTDAQIKFVEQFTTLVLDCFFKEKIKQAKITYQKAEGIFDASAALVQVGLLETTYSTLRGLKDASIVITNCLDGAATGGNDSAVGIGCDFITSMLAVGDVRDLIKQTWNYHISPDDYDELEANLAALGLLASAAQLIPGAGQTAGVVISAALSSVKIIVKVIKRSNKAGKGAGRALAKRIARIVQSDKSLEQKGEAFQALLPFIEMTAAIVLIKDDNPEIFDVMINAISTDDGQDAIIEWIGDYFERLESELLRAEINKPFNPFKYLMSSAYADISSDLQRKFLKELTTLIAQVKRINPEATSEVIADTFIGALEQFLRLSKDPNFISSLTKGKVQDFLILNAFINVKKIGGDDTVKRFALHAPYTLGYGKNLFSGDEYVKAFAELPLDKLNPQSLQGLRGILNKFQNNGGAGNKLGIAKGPIAHAFFIADMLKRSDVEIENIEILDRAASTTRFTDLVVRINGQLIKVEFKNYFADTWAKNLGNGMKNKPTKAGQEGGEDFAAEVAGQLAEDLANLAANKYKGYQWVFTPDVLPDSRTLTKAPTDAVLIKQQDEILEHIISLIDDNVLTTIMQKQNLDKVGPIKDPDKRLAFKDGLVEQLKELQKSDMPFISITKFEQIIKSD